jgi:hypothetical protein
MFTFVQPEIGQVYVIGPPRPRVQQHVRGFDISVHQPGGMSSI